MTLLLDVVTTAAILFCLSAGLLVVFGVLKIINFAHGAFITVGAFAALLGTWIGLPFVAAVALAFAVGALLGGVVERVLVRPLYHRPLDAILVTWGLGIVLAQLIIMGFGRGIQFVDAPLPGTVDVLGTSYSTYRLAMVGAAIGIGVAFTALLNGTRLGLSTRAVIMNETLAQALGINSARVRFVTFGLGCGLAAMAGALITPLASVDPNMGIAYLTGAFMLVMVSGGSLPTLAVACLVLGSAQVLASSFITPVVGALAIPILAALALRLRPEGFARA
ncbi:branched-chain amino acid ABC transporter permease [Aureimonas sp. SK2]|uniref:branched-chain amino acid ABC transporter permease n=1 Tax=Aureimonas sp. SK2 TaxID=3015992 RepID=UPI00244527A4|nr:branched-chain amino acid ABC transporter permease [Aureimonas sp. SK2]